MIKNIQKYLLLHHPMIWNIRIVPMLIILVGVHLVFFGLGYISTDTTFGKSYYYYSPENDLVLLYFVSVLVGILLLIGWLVLYNRNNAFRTFYPRTTSQLYLEWILMLIITIGLTFIPFTLTQGYVAQWRSVATISEAKKAIETLDDAKLLVAYDNDYYRYKADYDKPIPIPDNMPISPDTLDLSLFETEYSGRDGIKINGYVGPSFLFYKNDNYYYYNNTRQYIDSARWLKIKRQERVKQWLKTGNKDSIHAIMKDFELLQQKHNFKINITPDQWYKRIYNPPYFPVNGTTAILNFEPNEYQKLYTPESYDIEYPVVEGENQGDIKAIEEVQYNQYEQIRGNAIPYLQYNELSQGYEQVLRYHRYNDDITWMALFCMCFALAISIFIFSFRATSGKSWLIAFVSTGVLIFIVVLSGVSLGEAIDWNDEEIIVIFVCLFWLLLFAGLITRICTKVKMRSNKGRSNIYMNLMLWMVPCIIPLIFVTVVAFIELSNNNYIKDKDVICMLWINIPIVILSMWPVGYLVRKWKSIADE